MKMYYINGTSSSTMDRCVLYVGSLEMHPKIDVLDAHFFVSMRKK